MDAQILREKSLESCYQAFQKAVPKSHCFQVAYELLAWLQDDILTSSERISGIYILLELSKQSESIFLPTVAEVVDISPFPWEKLLLQEWVKSKELGKMTQEQVVKLTGEAREIDHIKRSRAIRNVINTGTTEKTHAFLGKYEPEFMRPIPDFMEMNSGETKWITPSINPEVLWDTENESERAFNEGIRDLMRAALHSKLSPEQYNAICEALENDPKLVLKCGINYTNLGDLVNNNPSVAVELLVKLSQSQRMQDYLEQILEMPMSLNALEVVNKLANFVELPAEFLHLFVTNCMKSCTRIRDKYTQNRLVRLLCVFINSLLKNQFLNSSELQSEIQQFCMEFTTIKEANDLNKALNTSSFSTK